MIIVVRCAGWQYVMCECECMWVWVLCGNGCVLAVWQSMGPARWANRTKAASEFVNGTVYTAAVAGGQDNSGFRNDFWVTFAGQGVCS